MSIKKEQQEKSRVVLNAEKTFIFLNLECHKIIKELDKVSARLNNIEKRIYTVPRKVLYHFTYNLNGTKKYLIIVRKAGNSQTLETNLRKAISKDFEFDLKQMINKKELIK